MKVIIVGGGGQGLIVADILLRAREAGSSAEAIGFVDDTRALMGKSILGLAVLGPIDALDTVPHDGIVIAVGDNHVRRELSEHLISRGERLITARHPFTSIAPDVRIGDGSMISAGAIISPGVLIGRGMILNTKASVDHNTIIGDFAHVSAGGTVGANCTIGDEVLVALGASVVSRRCVGARTVIGAGAVVVHDIPAGVVAYGVPARVTSDRRSENPNP